jgi:hypothetical protein
MMCRSNRWAWAVAAVACAWPGAAEAQTYQTRVVARNLASPTGIAAEDRTSIYFTQLPTPGVGGGQNTVSVLNPRSGRVRHLVTGEPEPTNLAVDFFGEVYWTCKSAGVVNTLLPGNQVDTILTGLNKPNGIAAYPFGFFLLFTEVPTPGVGGANGGQNTVSFATADGTFDFPLDLGDPEPTDVAVAINGDVYWTCSSAGVIVRQSGGTNTVILSGLNRPTGIALDHRGNLYFTELPTPGVGGANGGSNKVYKYDLDEDELELINAGDPDPVDVTVLRNGTVYWTCRSAGVIVEARRVH